MKIFFSHHIIPPPEPLQHYKHLSIIGINPFKFIQFLQPHPLFQRILHSGVHLQTFNNPKDLITLYPLWVSARNICSVLERHKNKDQNWITNLWMDIINWHRQLCGSLRRGHLLEYDPLLNCHSDWTTVMRPPESAILEEKGGNPGWGEGTPQHPQFRCSNNALIFTQNTMLLARRFIIYFVFFFVI